MATLQKIRSKGALLILFVGLALFAFIAEEGVRSLSSSRAESHQRIGKVYGESINIQEFNDLVDEYTDVVKFTSGMDNLSEEQVQSIRDMVWRNHVESQLLQHEADELGLTVTDAEVQDIIQKGQSPLLAQTPFSNPQTGTFDVQALNQFLTQYNSMKGQAGQPAEAIAYYEQVYNYWKFLEKNIRQQALTGKFQALLAKSFISNPTSVQNAFDARNNEKDVLLVTLPYSSIKEGELTVDEKDLKAKYEEKKELFRLNEPTRDIKYIDVAITASKADREQLNAEMAEIAEQLRNASAEDIANVVRKSGSSVAYSTVPVRRNALPSDIAKQLDSMTVGAQVGPYLNAGDNTQNIVRLLAKTSLPDSVQFRQISVTGADEAAAQKTADSVMTALNAGVPFDSIAKKYNQTGDEVWLTSQQYENSMLDENNRKFIAALSTQAAGTTQQIHFGNQINIVRVLDRKNFVDKYDIAVVKRSIDFSNDTYNKTYNDFSQFVASNKTLEEIEANAMKSGYMVQQRQGIMGSEHNVAGLSSTREAFRWIFNEDTKVGEISEIYTCGNNDHLLVVVLTDKNDGQYRTLESVKDYIEDEALRDKKAASLQEKLAACNDLAAAAKVAGALPVDTIRHITFSSPVFVSSIGSREAALSGAVARAKKDEFVKGVKGMAGVYSFKVLSEKKNDAKLDDAAKKSTQAQLANQNFRAASNFIQALYERADVKDARYLFY